MFGKREEINEKLAEISNEIAGIRKENAEMKSFNSEAFSKIDCVLKDMKSAHSCYTEKISSEVESIISLNSEFSKCIRSFELLHKRIYDQLYTRVHELLKEHQNDLKSTSEAYKSTEPKMREMLACMDSMAQEISKFKAIASRIRESDFELSSHQKNLERLDREKLHLLKKIDSLEHMVGKYRRNKSY